MFQPNELLPLIDNVGFEALATNILPNENRKTTKTIVDNKIFRIGKFLAALALEERLYNVLNVNYSSPSATGEMQVTFELVSYQYKEG